MKNKILFIGILLLSVKVANCQTNWELLNPKPTVDAGLDIAFVSDKVGYILTSNELLETKDAGYSWHKKQDITRGHDISFYKNIGFIVGWNGYILNSKDSGENWAQISTGYDYNFNSVSIIDENNIMLSDQNNLLKSNDGGVSWKRLSIPNDRVLKIFFTSSLVGYAACWRGTMLKTIDGGENWYTTASTNSQPSDFFTVHFVNENIGFASQEHRDMFKTIDGGETWAEIEGIHEAIYSIHFLDENIGYVAGDYGSIFKTIDGGSTWTGMGIQNPNEPNAPFKGIIFNDVNVGFATGNLGRIIKTTDGGNSWTQNSPTYRDFNEIKVFESGVGFARARKDFYKTTDFGDNWDFLSRVNHYSSASGSFFVNESIGFSIGWGTTSISGDVFKTTDGGISWTKLDILVDEGLSSIFFIDENDGFISGGFNRRVLFKTTDGGNTWTKVLDKEFYQIQFLNSEVGYALVFRDIYKTVDGGNTWNFNISAEDDINAFHFVDENNGYFVGDNGLIHKTNDGGNNWQELDIPYECYELVKFYSKNVGYIYDERGKMYKTENGGASWEHINTNYGINSIEFLNDIIFVAGYGGKICRGKVDYEPIVLHINLAQNISNTSATLSGNAASNENSISNVKFEYGLDESLTNNTISAPISVASNESLNFSFDLTDLNQSTTYYFRLKGTQNSIEYKSEILNFTTLPDYEIVTNSTNRFSYTSNKANIFGVVVSNEYEITDIKFQYGTNKDTLNSNISGMPELLNANTWSHISANLDNLKPETQYFYRLKATHNGEDIYADIESFMTYPAYEITVLNPNGDESEASLTAYVESYDYDITDIVIEYGSAEYENSVVPDLSHINAGNSEQIRATLTDLNTNFNYYLRLKGTRNNESIYSDIVVFNLSRDIVLLSGSVEETSKGTLELNGLINSYGADLTDVHFEYGITDNLGLKVIATPSTIDDYKTNLATASINNPKSNQTYFYKLGVTYNGDVIYSDLYQYTTGTLNTTVFPNNKQISIYPNPAKELVYVELKNNDVISNIEIYNALGQPIHIEKKFNSSTSKIDISVLDKGLYFLKINYLSDDILFKNFVKQ